MALKPDAFPAPIQKVSLVKVWIVNAEPLLAGQDGAI